MKRSSIKKQFDKNTLFLSGVVVLASSVLLFYLNPFQILDRDFWLWMTSFVHEPVAKFGFSYGSLFAI